MKNRFYIILLPFLLMFIACQNETQEGENKTSEMSHEITTKKRPPLIISEEPMVKKTTPKAYHFTFQNLKGEVSTLDVKHDIYDFKNIKQPIVIINAMSTWCPPCRGQLPHLSKLQQKFKENVFVMATLVHDDIPKEKLEKLLIAEKALFYLSITQKENLKFINMLTPKLGLSSEFPMPLTVLFVHGKYFTHYEGMIPEEMIESDIQQLLQKIKK